MTLTEITQGLEKAVASIDSKRTAVASAEKALANAQNGYNEAMQVVKDLHKAYTDFMGGVLTNFGQLHK